MRVSEVVIGNGVSEITGYFVGEWARSILVWWMGERDHSWCGGLVSEIPRGVAKELSRSLLVCRM